MWKWLSAENMPSSIPTLSLSLALTWLEMKCLAPLKTVQGFPKWTYETHPALMNDSKSPLRGSPPQVVVLPVLRIDGTKASTPTFFDCSCQAASAGKDFKKQAFSASGEFSRVITRTACALMRGAVTGTSFKLNWCNFKIPANQRRVFPTYSTLG